MNFKHLENVYSKATSVFFYDVFDMLLNSDDSDNLFVVFVARRCFVLSRLYLNEYIINKKLDQVSIQKIKSHIFTDSAFRMLSLTLSEKCYKTDYVFSVLLCDDILIHGRSIGELLSSAESLFIKKYYELSEIKKIDYELNEQISKKFLHNIKIKTIFRSGPCCTNISFNNIIVDDDEIGLSIAIGNISFGKIFIFISDMISFKKLLLTKTVTDMIRANIDGKISRLIFNPSLTPVKNSS